MGWHRWDAHGADSVRRPSGMVLHGLVLRLHFVAAPSLRTAGLAPGPPPTKTTPTMLAASPLAGPFHSVEASTPIPRQIRPFGLRRPICRDLQVSDTRRQAIESTGP